MTKALILGANGKLGSLLRRHGQRAGLDWHGFARDGSGDVTDPFDDAYFGPGNTVINMAGYTGSDPVKLHEANVTFAASLYTRAADTGLDHVVLASSAAVYGPGSTAPFDEDSPLKPVTDYGLSKARMEDAVLTIAAKGNGPALTILRIGNVAGADALTAAAHHHIETETAMPLHRLSDGSAPQRSYIGPLDLARAVETLARPHDEGARIINVAHSQPVTLDAVLMGYKTHVLPELAWYDTPAPEGTPASVTLSTLRLEQHLSFEHHNTPAMAFAAQITKDRGA